MQRLLATIATEGLTLACLQFTGKGMALDTERVVASGVCRRTMHWCFRLWYQHAAVGTRGKAISQHDKIMLRPRHSHKMSNECALSAVGRWLACVVVEVECKNDVGYD